MKKRLLSILLTICMVLSLLPATALAADPTPVLAEGSIARTTTLDLATNANLSYRATDGTTKSKNPTTTSITDTAEGWSWVSSSKTLTLSGVHIQVPNQTVAKTASRGIYLPDGAVSIVLTAGTQNLVRAGDAAATTELTERSAAIDVDVKATIASSVTISGTGELVAIGGKAFISIGIATWLLTVNGGAQVTTIGADTPQQSYGISSTGLKVEGAATRVNAIGGKADNQALSYGITADTFTLTDGVVLASGHKTGLGKNNTPPTINVNGGLLIAKGVGTAGKALSTVATPGNGIGVLAGANNDTSVYTVLGSSGTYKTSTAPLEFAADTADAGVLDTDGYHWDNATDTLTLKNCIVTPASGAIYNGIKLPERATLNLVGNNVVRGGDGATVGGTPDAAAIYGTGALTINGTGGLTAIAGKHIYDNRSCGILTDSNLALSGGAKVTALADAKRDAYGIWAGSAIVSDAGTALTALGFSSDAGTANSETQGILGNGGVFQIDEGASVVSISGPAAKLSRGVWASVTLKGQLLAVGMNSITSSGVTGKVTTAHADARLKASGGTGRTESYGILGGFSGSQGTVTAVAGVSPTNSYGVAVLSPDTAPIALSGTAKLHAVGNDVALWGDGNITIAGTKILFPIDGAISCNELNPGKTLLTHNGIGESVKNAIIAPDVAVTPPVAGAAITTAAAVASKTANSITVNAAAASANHGNQTIEYAINTNGTTAPITGYQSGLTFSGLIADTGYYVWARTAAKTGYDAGTAVASALITTAATPSGETSVTTYAQLTAALANPSIAKINLAANIIATAGMSIPRNVTIDGGGHTLSATVTGTDEWGKTQTGSDYTLLTVGSGKTLTLNNMTIKGGSKTAVSNAGTLRMDKVIITQSGYNLAYGGGLYNSGNAVLTNCAFTRNVASSGGGFLNERGTMIMDNCSVTENRSLRDGGGGGESKDSATLYLNNCTFANNQSIEIGGGINNYRSTLYALNTTVVGNISDSDSGADGGGIGYNGGTVTLVNSIVSNNYAKNNVGAFVTSDIGVRGGSTLNAYHSLVGAYVKDATGTTETVPGANNDTVITDVFAGYLDSVLLDGSGAPIPATGLGKRPVLVKQTNGTYAAPLSATPPDNKGINGGCDVRFAYNPATAAVSVMAYNTTAIPTFGVGTDSDKVVTFQNGSARTIPNIIRGGMETGSDYYTVKVAAPENCTVTGGTAFGDTYAVNAQVAFTATPASGYTFDGWYDGADAKLSGSASYTHTVTADITITAKVTPTIAAAVTITGVSVANKTYDGQPVSHTGTPVAKLADNNTVTIASYDYTYYLSDGTTKTTPANSGAASEGTAPKNAGSYKLVVAVPTSNVSYSGKQEIAFTVNQATITVTASSKSAYVGDTAPVLAATDYTVAGLASGEVLKTLPTPPSYATMPDMTKAGTVVINIAGAAAPDGGNYDAIVYVPGTLTISTRSSSGGDYTPPKKPVIIDGKTENIGTEKKTGDTTVITVDQPKLTEQIGKAKEESSVVVPVSGNTTATVSLVVKNVEDMAKKDMTLSVTTGSVTYNLPTASMDTAALADAFPGQDTAKIPFEVTIKTSDVKVEGTTVVVKPMGFTVAAVYGGKSVTVDEFSTFVERTFEITKAQSEKITTAVVVEQGGTLRHVPTNVFQKDGKYYATVNSMTNSVYTLVQNEVTFADAAGKWYADVANEVGSRKIVVGTDNGAFNGDAKITRAEYATMMVRALGLPQSKSSSFTDVPANAWYAGYVATASEYGIVKGIGKNKFNPEGLITRQEAMQMIYNASKLTGFPKLLNARNLAAEFGDFATVDKWAVEAVSWCLNNNLSVNLNGEVKPSEEITRGEMSAMILLLLQRSELVDVRAKA